MTAGVGGRLGRQDDNDHGVPGRRTASQLCLHIERDRLAGLEGVVREDLPGQSRDPRVAHGREYGSEASGIKMVLGAPDRCGEAAKVQAAAGDSLGGH